MEIYIKGVFCMSKFILIIYIYNYIFIPADFFHEYCRGSAKQYVSSTSGLCMSGEMQSCRVVLEVSSVKKRKNGNNDLIPKQEMIAGVLLR